MPNALAKKISGTLVVVILVLFIAVLIKAWFVLDSLPVYFRSSGGSFFSIDTGRNKIEIKRTGSDGMRYYFSISDTIPTYPSDIRTFFSSPDTTPTYPGYPRTNEPYSNPEYTGPQDVPHISMFQGDPLHLHSVVTLENGRTTGDDSLAAIIGVVDLCGHTNNVLKATPSGIDLYIRRYFDKEGGANYKFTRDGIEMNRLGKKQYTLTNTSGKKGQVLTLNGKGDTAEWKNLSLHLENLQLPEFKSVRQARASKLQKGTPFILTLTQDGVEYKTIAFIP